jgi:hypothetical protein
MRFAECRPPTRRGSRGALAWPEHPGEPEHEERRPNPAATVCENTTWANVPGRSRRPSCMSRHRFGTRGSPLLGFPRTRGAAVCQPESISGEDAGRSASALRTARRRWSRCRRCAGSSGPGHLRRGFHEPERDAAQRVEPGGVVGGRLGLALTAGASGDRSGQMPLELPATERRSSQALRHPFRAPAPARAPRTPAPRCRAAAASRHRGRSNLASSLGFALMRSPSLAPWERQCRSCNRG